MAKQQQIVGFIEQEEPIINLKNRRVDIRQIIANSTRDNQHTYNINTSTFVNITIVLQLISNLKLHYYTDLRPCFWRLYKVT